VNILSSAYAPPDGGLGDFCLARNADEWHLFHIYREYGKPLDCHVPGQEAKIGHAVSNDLIHWETREPAILAGNAPWDSAHVWAPSVVRHNGVWYMLYTGMKDDIYQQIGVATSDDLEHWHYPVDTPVIDVSQYDWAAYETEGYTNCRDPYIFRWQNEWLCYYTAMHQDGTAALGVAGSSDMLHWQDKGCVLKRPIQNNEGRGTNMIESPCVFHIGAKIFLFYNQGTGIRYIASDDPMNFEGQPLRKFQDGIYNFEMLDSKTGLFAYASGGYYSCVRFGYVKLSMDSKSWHLGLNNSQKKDSCQL